MGRLPRTPSPGPGSARSPRSSAARRRRATCGPTPTRPRSPRRTSERGAAAVSVLVDERFGGTGTTCGRRAPRPRLPLLAKGFFIEPEHVARRREAGADAVLLMLRDRRRPTRAAAHGEAPRSSAWTLLVEAHDAAELERAVALGADVIGVNARDLATFEIDRARAARAGRARAARPRRRRRERRSRHRAQGAAAELAGADAVLVGSALMRAPDPAAKLASCLAAARQGLRADARGGRRRRGRGGRRPGRLHPRREPAPRGRAAPGPGRRALGRRLRRRGRGRRRRPRPALPGARTATAPATAALLRAGAEVARVLDLPWLERGRRRTGRAARGRAAASCSPAGSGPENVARGGRAVRPWAVDAAAASRRRRGSRITTRCARSWRRRDDATGSSASYGGRYVPETLVPALDELERGLARGVATTSSTPSSTSSRDTYVGRPTPLYLAERLGAGQADLPQARGSLPHRRAQDQQRARPGAARAAARQAADRRRDRRRPARRRDRDGVRALRPRVRRLHGRRGHAPPAPNVERMRLLGAEVRPGRVRHEDAQGGDERGDPRLDHERRDDALPDRLLRRPASVPGARARPAGRDRPRGAGADARGRGPPARRRRRLRRRRLERDRDVRRLPRRRGRAARRRRGGRRGAPRHRPGRASCTARARRSSRTTTARSPTRTRSRPGSTTPASGPSTRTCATPAAPSTCTATDEEALAASTCSREREGIIPALEPSHALAPGARPATRSSIARRASPAAATRTSRRCSRPSDADARKLSHLPDGRAGDAGARGGRGRRGRRPARDRLPLLRPAGRRAGHPPGRGARARRGHADARVPRVPRGDARRGSTCRWCR